MVQRIMYQLKLFLFFIVNQTYTIKYVKSSKRLQIIEIIFI